jgi:hypothetical protein
MNVSERDGSDVPATLAWPRACLSGGERAREAPLVEAAAQSDRRRGLGAWALTLSACATLIAVMVVSGGAEVQIVGGHLIFTCGL